MENDLTRVLAWQQNRWFPFKDQIINSAQISAVSKRVSQVIINDRDHFYVPFVKGFWTLPNFFMAEVSAEELSWIEGSTNIIVKSTTGQILKFYPSAIARAQRELKILQDISKNKIGPKVLAHGEHYVLLEELSGPNLWDALLDSPKELFLRCYQLLEVFHQSTPWNHGDFHLGQVILTPDALKMIDFEGEISQGVEECKQNQLYDWVCFFRSLHYWCLVNQEPSFWSFVENKILDFCQDQDVILFKDLMGKRLAHELNYEKSYRPSWVYIPQAGMSWWHSFQNSF